MGKLINTKETAILISTYNEGIKLNTWKKEDCIAKYIKFICEKCGKEEIKRDVSFLSTKRLICGPCLRKEGTLKAHGSETWNNQEKNKQTCLSKYGVENPFQLQKVIDITKNRDWTERNKKSKQTCLEKYGVENPAQINSVKEKIKNTVNDIPDFYKNIAIKTAKTRSKLEPIDGICVDSSWEQNFIKLHLGCKRGPQIEYYDENNKKRFWCVDFEWNGKLYEIKNPWMLTEGNKWYGNSKLKFDLSKQLGIRWYLWNPGQWEWPKLDEIEEFRATKCHVGKMKNPWEAFNDPIFKFKAEENLAKYITWPGMLDRFFCKGGDKMLYERFTIAKIAPKVTVGSKSEAKKHLIYAKKLWGNFEGVINPCAGFGGWAKACKELNISYIGRDINKELCLRFNWEICDLLTCEPIKTNYIVWCSPPVLEKETWGEKIAIKSEEEWYNLIKEKIIASHYIFVNGTNDSTGGLFGNKNRKVIFN